MFAARHPVSMLKKCHNETDGGYAPTTRMCYTVVTGYTPVDAREIVSLNSQPGLPIASSNDIYTTVIIPTNAVIDRIEYEGEDLFQTKGNFHLGLGQLHHSILFPLIENGTLTIANEKSGGCREFTTSHPTGENSKNKVLYPSMVNVALTNPITHGSLRVDIYYHIKN